jgi:hypothetical protein
MKKGAVPIPYIIAMLLGIAVVAILGYWFFVLGGQWGGEVTLQRCRSKAVSYCTMWQGNGYATSGTDPDLGGVTGVKWFSKTAGAYDERCEDYGILDESTTASLETSCKGILTAA